MHADNQTTTLLLGGDVMTGRGIAQVLARRPGRSVEETDDVEAVRLVRLAEQLNGPVPIPVSPRYVWGEALEEIQRAEPDAFIVALETAVKTSEQLACLKAGRVTICALACDGAPHAGEELGQTRRSLAKARMQATGAGRNVVQAQTPAVLVLGPRHRVLVYSWAAPDCGAAVDAAAAPDRPGIAVLPDLAERGLARIAVAVAAHRRDGDLLVHSIHWGTSHSVGVSAQHRWFARELVDRDLADLIHGHAAQHPLPFEIHRGKLVLYGCGDLINDHEGLGPDGERARDLGCLYFATLSQQSGRLARLNIVPMQRRAFRLVHANAASRTALWRTLQLKEGHSARQFVWRPDGHWLIDAAEPAPSAVLGLRPIQAGVERPTQRPAASRRPMDMKQHSPHPKPQRRRGPAHAIPEHAPETESGEGFVQHPDGWYWTAPDGLQQFGPFETCAFARADRDRVSEEAVDEAEAEREAEQALGVEDAIHALADVPAGSDNTLPSAG